MSALKITNLTVQLNGSKVLRNVDFEAGAGEITGLIGPNGAGKSTLLRTAIGLIPHEGEVAIMGSSRLGRSELARTVAYLPQLMEVHWPLSAEAIVALGRYPHGGYFESRTKADDKAIRKALSAVDGLKFADRNVLSLSAGERARVLLARALAVEAPVLLVDEPVASLDPEHQLRVMDILKTLAGQGVAVVIVLHDLTLASRFCDRLTLLDRGRVVSAGTPQKVLNTKNLRDVFKITTKRGKNYLIPWSVTP